MLERVALMGGSGKWRGSLHAGAGHSLVVDVGLLLDDARIRRLE